MRPIQPLPSYDAAQTVVSAYVLLFLAAFGAATVLPLPSEVPFAYVVRQSGERGWPVLVGRRAVGGSAGRGRVVRQILARCGARCHRGHPAIVGGGAGNARPAVRFGKFGYDRMGS